MMTNRLDTNPAKTILQFSVALILLVATVSCKPAPDPMLDMLDTQLASYRIDNLSRSMDLVKSPERFQISEFEDKLAASLNGWAKTDADLMVKEQWQPDALIGEWTELYSDLQPVAKLAELSFIHTDSWFVQQRFWFEQLGRRLIASRDMGPFELYRKASGLDLDTASAGADRDPLADVLQKLHDKISSDDAEKLAIAVKLFDWTVRNIHLLPENDLLAGVDDPNELRLNDAEDPAAAGIPGTGYTRFPWQTMLFSRGDYLDRAKIFMMMIDQFGLDSVMLSAATNDPDKTDQKPWAVAVSIGGELYLFDTRLGMPIPGIAPGTIAALAAVKADPKILAALDLTVNESLSDNTTYWVGEDQLADLTGSVYATPESVSYRFWELENKLVGQDRLKLVSRPTEVIARLPQIEGLKYGVWDIALKNHQFRRALRDAIAEASFKDDVRDRIQWYYNEESYIYDFVQYRTARAKYFLGLFETIRNDGNLNSVELFYKMIYKDSKIDSLASDKIFQNQLSLSEGNNLAEFENIIRGVQHNMRLVRRDSGFFLAQCHFDNGNFGTAINWLTRLEEIEDTVRWQPAINYLRGRSLEAQRDYNAAIESFQNQESEQFHGNLIRARLLKQLSEIM